MGDIIIIPLLGVIVDLSPEGLDDMIRRMNSIIFFTDVLLTVGYLNWDNLVLNLDGIWDLSCVCQLVWFWGHLLDIHLKIKLASFLAWKLEIILAHRKYLWLNFHWSYWVGWLLALDNDLWLSYHWDFRLTSHLSLLILGLWLLELLWAFLLGCVLALKRSAVDVPNIASQTSVNLRVGV